MRLLRAAMNYIASDSPGGSLRRSVLTAPVAWPETAFSRNGDGSGRRAAGMAAGVGAVAGRGGVLGSCPGPETGSARTAPAEGGGCDRPRPAPRPRGENLEVGRTGWAGRSGRIGSAWTGARGTTPACGTARHGPRRCPAAGAGGRNAAPGPIPCRGDRFIGPPPCRSRPRSPTSPTLRRRTPGGHAVKAGLRDGSAVAKPASSSGHAYGRPAHVRRDRTLG
ncbi:Uncharacterised protein [Mycobacterium tuberculosis]|nr:Uncharacterised protein [Mycobacterium tuberculosis]